MKESILILGGGKMQEPAIHAAKEEGFKVFVVDANPNACCIKYADVFEKIDLKDKEGILNFAQKISGEGLKGIFTVGTDFSSSVSYAAEKLNLPCHSFDSALNASIKSRMRTCFKSSSLPCPGFFTIKDSLNFNNNRFDYPYVVKPVDNMGARGCRLVRNKEEEHCAINTALENSRSSSVIVEEYMDGPEFSIDALIYDGTLTITGFADRHIFYPPYFIETGHTMSTLIDKKKRLELIAVFALGVKSLNLKRGAAKADIKYTKNGVQIGEIAARLSGGYMSGWTFRYSSGLNLVKEALFIATGKVPALIEKRRKKIEFLPPDSCKNKEKPFELYEIKCRKTSAERAWISIPGKISSVQGLDFAKKILFVKDVFPSSRCCKGACVDFPRNNVEKCGNIISSSIFYYFAVKSAQKAVSKIFMRLEPRNEATDKYLEGFFRSDEKNFPPNAFNFPEISCSFKEKIPADKKVIKCVPDCLKKYLKAKQTDWNYLTFKQTLKKFDKICRKHGNIDADRFWKSVLRGGIQAAVYVSDSFSEYK